MSIYNLNKGDHVNFGKYSGLNKLEVKLGWNGDFELDACVFLLGKNGSILNDADFVYYNSENRTLKFEEVLFGNKTKWKSITSPLSFDGSICIPNDDIEYVDSEQIADIIMIDFDKIHEKIQTIVFVLVIYGDSGVTFKNVENPFIKITNSETGEEIIEYTVSQKFGSETGIEVGNLIRNSEGEWEFFAIGKGYQDGLKKFIEMYA